mmetsp:Transcript_7426/g.22240  ORF Transcript_7426/g.22240 Transcript_7426/m.22240 type:complete len:219 (-) Transcript_7426:300-956(-)
MPPNPPTAPWGYAYPCCCCCWALALAPAPPCDLLACPPKPSEPEVPGSEACALVLACDPSSCFTADEDGPAPCDTCWPPPHPSPWTLATDGIWPSCMIPISLAKSYTPAVIKSLKKSSCREFPTANSSIVGFDMLISQARCSHLLLLLHQVQFVVSLCHKGRKTTDFPRVASSVSTSGFCCCCRFHLGFADPKNAARSSVRSKSVRDRSRVLHTRDRS